MRGGEIWKLGVACAAVRCGRACVFDSPGKKRKQSQANKSDVRRARRKADARVSCVSLSRASVLRLFESPGKRGSGPKETAARLPGDAKIRRGKKRKSPGTGARGKRGQAHKPASRTHAASKGHGGRGEGGGVAGPGAHCFHPHPADTPLTHPRHTRPTPATHPARAADTPLTHPTRDTPATHPADTPATHPRHTRHTQPHPAHTHPAAPPTRPDTRRCGTGLRGVCGLRDFCGLRQFARRRPRGNQCHCDGRCQRDRAEGVFVNRAVSAPTVRVVPRSFLARPG